MINVLAGLIIFGMGVAAGWWVGYNFCMLGVKENLKNGNLVWKGRKWY